MVSIAMDPILDIIANLEQRESGKSNDKTIRSNSDDPSKRGSFVCVVASLSCMHSSMHSVLRGPDSYIYQSMRKLKSKSDALMSLVDGSTHHVQNLEEAYQPSSCIASSARISVAADFSSKSSRKRVNIPGGGP